MLIGTGSSPSLWSSDQDNARHTGMPNKDFLSAQTWPNKAQQSHISWSHTRGPCHSCPSLCGCDKKHPIERGFKVFVLWGIKIDKVWWNVRGKKSHSPRSADPGFSSLSPAPGCCSQAWLCGTAPCTAAGRQGTRQHWVMGWKCVPIHQSSLKEMSHGYAQSSQ